MLRYVGYLRDTNQLDALFYSQFISIIITSTCFQQAYCSSSGGAYVCIEQLVKKKKLCRLVYRNQHFGGIYCLRLQGIFLTALEMRQEAAPRLWCLCTNLHVAVSQKTVIVSAADRTSVLASVNSFLECHSFSFFVVLTTPSI
jgi:hypothetical protein